jgi:hypothetical protein
MRLCGYLWLAALSYAVFRKVAIEHWRPHFISDFILIPVLLLTALIPFALAKADKVDGRWR